MTAYVESMAYYGETPWHNLGTKLDKPATSEEAIIASGLNWEVVKYPLTMEKDSSTSIRVPGYYALTRKADNRIYNIVKDRYNPLQNRDAFKFFDDVVGKKLAIYHTAGSLKNGAIVWILARLSECIKVKNDAIDEYLLLRNPHDGSGAVEMFFTPIRVVCWNTLAMAESSTVNKFYARHTTNMMSKIQDAQELLQLSQKYFLEQEEKYNFIAGKQLTNKQLDELIRTALNITEEKEFEDIYGPMKREYEKVQELLETGRGLNNPEIRGSAYWAYNAVVEYVDYYKNIRGNDKEDKRLYSAWFGSGNNIKNRALDFALAV